MSIHEFLHLTKGDVIELNQSINKPLLVNVGGERKYYAQPGKMKNKIAVQVTEIIEEAENDE